MTRPVFQIVFVILCGCALTFLCWHYILRVWRIWQGRCYPGKWLGKRAEWSASPWLSLLKRTVLQHLHIINRTGQMSFGFWVYTKSYHVTSRCFVFKQLCYVSEWHSVCCKMKSLKSLHRTCKTFPLRCTIYLQFDHNRNWSNSWVVHPSAPELIEPTFVLQVEYQRAQHALCHSHWPARRWNSQLVL